jgi:RNA polymerase sigma-70 factor (ECF subfamily)
VAHGPSASVLAIRREADMLEGSTIATHATRELVPDAVARAREGHPDALRFLYLRFRERVRSYVSSIVHDDQAAEDVTQNVFARLEDRLQRYEPRTVPFAGWITRVAHNAAIDHVRSQRLVLCEEVRDPQVANENVGRDRLEAIREALSVLPRDQRDVLMLRFVVGLTPGEIAERLGRSENAVHALQHRGRRRLRHELIRLEAAPAVSCG